MTELSRHPQESTQELRNLDAWHAQQARTLMTSESLTPVAKQRRLEELRKEYQQRWLQAADAARRDLAEWSEIFEARAESAYEPKAPEDKDARILRALDLQRLHGRIERNKERPGALLAEYERALRSGNHHVAHELEDALPALLPESARADFAARAKEERFKRLSEDDRKKVAEAEAWKREAMTTGLALAHQETNRARGFAPATPSPTTLVTTHKAGPEPPSVSEIPNPNWRNPAYESPTNEPVGGTIAPDPGSAA